MTFSRIMLRRRMLHAKTAKKLATTVTSTAASPHRTTAINSDALSTLSEGGAAG
jgi:hypothetical protein